ncbi:MAG TPA: transglycosylase domain-containing protein [Anaerolineales bacterium]|nr:transglycosylase domain-containing protein [Anaerolineales bacterium]
MTNEEEKRREEENKRFLKRLIDSEAETRTDLPAEPKEEPNPNATTKASPPRRTPTPPPHIALDENNLPLPRRVDELDMEGTRVSPVAYEPPSKPRSAGTRSAPPTQLPSQPPAGGRLRAFDWRGGWGGCLVRGFLVALFGVVLLLILGGSIFLYSYYSIARTLPSVEDLKTRASQFETTRILDRNGNPLYDVIDPNAGRRTYVTLDKISPTVLAATIATEDKDFYNHPGFDVWAIVRALWKNYWTEGEGGGASTITQQLARTLLLSPEERAQRTYARKAREIILAAEITRRYTKDEILELYLNENNYGNLSYGIEAAAETYFGKTANQLDLAEASFLAGLPQSPAIYDIYTNRDVTLARQQQVLVLMYEASQAYGCIKVSNSDAPICVDAITATNAANDIKNRTFNPPVMNARYPHWVNFIRSELEEMYDAQTIYRSGFTVYTTIDPTMQDEAQRLVTEQVSLLTDKNAHNGALVAIKPSTGEIIAMVGSPDFNNEAISGQINMADSPTRQPGSSIKPINYVAAFEKGWTPATLIWDVPSEFPPSGDPNDTREPYRPVNYDGDYHGPVTVRTALSNSFNIPAVKTLDFVGIYDDPNTPQKDGMIGMAERLGITSFTRPDYGLALTLGGGDVSLLELTGAYSVFANGGKRVPPVAILKIVDYTGKVVYEYTPPQGEQVIRAEHAFLISSILSDNDARSWMFGRNSLLNLPFQVAAKTGTTNDFRDNWTLGYTPDLVTGVWVGNADYTPMVNTTGLTGAAPIWSSFMQYAVPIVSGGSPTPFAIPSGITQKAICSTSGAEPSQWCRGGQRNEYFASDQPPLPASQDLFRRANLDTWTGLLATDACKDFVEDEMMLNVSDKWARQWLRSGTGKDWLESHDMPRNPPFAPDRECKASDPHPVIEFSNINETSVITNPTLPISAVIDVKNGNFKNWQLEYGTGQNPSQWNLLTEGTNSSPSPSVIYTWNLEGIHDNRVTLRIHLSNGDDGEAERKLTLSINLPEPTATATSTPTEFPPTAIIPTETATATPTPTVTEESPPATDAPTSSSP